MRYNLEAYQKNFRNFICGSPTNVEVSDKDEKTKARPNGATQEKEV